MAAKELLITFGEEGQLISQKEWEKGNVEVSFMSKKTELAELIERMEKLDPEAVLHVARFLKIFLEEEARNAEGGSDENQH